ncbi:unnamed protein product [Symbiodinium microadriaticum]|nr:unnamed protein product [Symbiodinium microadriaticum]
MIMFLAWDYCHRWTGCVWDEILVTVDGFGAAMWEKYARSQGFGEPAYLDLGVSGGRGGYHRGGFHIAHVIAIEHHQNTFQGTIHYTARRVNQVDQLVQLHIDHEQSQILNLFDAIRQVVTGSNLRNELGDALKGDVRKGGCPLCSSEVHLELSSRCLLLGRALCVFGTLAAAILLNDKVHATHDMRHCFCFFTFTFGAKYGIEMRSHGEVLYKFTDLTEWLFLIHLKALPSQKKRYRVRYCFTPANCPVLAELLKGPSSTVTAMPTAEPGGFNAVSMSTEMPDRPRMAGTEGHGGNDPASQNRLVQMLQTAAHPVTCVFHAAFKIVVILIYIYGRYIHSAYVSTFILCTIFAALDFWTVKNISGRLLVGLRWWNLVKDDGSSEWVFESNPDEGNLNATDRNIFWGVTYIWPLLWAIFLFMNILNFSLDWVLLNIMIFIFAGTNLAGYWKCSTDAKKRAQQWVESQGMRAVAGAMGFA